MRWSIAPAQSRASPSAGAEAGIEMADRKSTRRRALPKGREMTAVMLDARLTSGFPYTQRHDARAGFLLAGEGYRIPRRIGLAGSMLGWNCWKPPRRLAATSTPAAARSGQRAAADVVSARQLDATLGSECGGSSLADPGDTLLRNLSADIKPGPKRACGIERQQQRGPGQEGRDGGGSPSRRCWPAREYPFPLRSDPAEHRAGAVSPAPAPTPGPLPRSRAQA